MRNVENQDEIRRLIRSARRDVSGNARNRWSAEICRRIAETDMFQAAKHVAGFLAFDGEADPIGLMAEAYEQGKKVYVPIILGRTKPLRFAAWSPHSKLSPNRFGILEPGDSDSNWIDSQDLDFVITPLVAFDKSCNRIGVGGGYYDRSFAFLSEETIEASQVKLVGFAFEMQKVDEIKGNDWDIPLVAVATESHFYQND